MHAQSVCVYLFAVLSLRSVVGKPVSQFTRSILKAPEFDIASGDPSFNICEQFNVTEESEMIGLHGQGITVVTRMPSWQLWLRQASLLTKLGQRFKEAAYPNVRFVIITDNETTAFHMREFTGNANIFAINDTEDSPFSRFMLRSVYVFDKCGQLTYMIRFPLSTVVRPFIKAAVLSTFYDRPCNNCVSGTHASQPLFSKRFVMRIIISSVFRKADDWSMSRRSRLARTY